MKSAFLSSLLVVFCSIPNFGQDVTSPSAAADAQGAMVLERGPHHRKWERVTYEVDAAGAPQLVTNSWTELVLGMHYFENGEFLESRAEVEPFPGGAIARRGQHRVIFAPNLATPGAIDMELPDGQRLRSHVLGLAYLDSASGSNIFLRRSRIVDFRTFLSLLRGSRWPLAC